MTGGLTGAGFVIDDRWRLLASGKAVLVVVETVGVMDGDSV